VYVQCRLLSIFRPHFVLLEPALKCLGLRVEANVLPKLDMREYLVAVIDWYSRYVVSWELDQSLEMTFVMAAVNRALETATPVIWNSDQGSHFTSPVYIERLKSANIQISMDGKGRAIDKAYASYCTSLIPCLMTQARSNPLR
jgi:transposase InsO family protein